jgi:hypothetical protein
MARSNPEKGNPHSKKHTKTNQPPFPLQTAATHRIIRRHAEA